MLLLGGLGLGDLGSDCGIVLAGVPENGTETQKGGNDGEDQGNNTLAGEGTGEGIGSNVGTGQVQALVTGSVARVWDAKGLAVVNVGGVDLETVLHELGSLNDGGGKTGLEMPLDVAMEEPNSGVVGLETDGNVLLRGNQDGITAGRVGGVEVAGIWHRGVVLALAATNNLEDVTVKMEGVVTRVVVVDDDLDPLAVLDDHGVGVLAVDLGVAVEVTGGKGSVQGGDLGHDVSDVVEGGLVGVVVQDREDGVQDKLLGRGGSSLGDDGNQISIVELLPLGGLLGSKGESLVIDNGAGDVQGELWGHDVEHGGVHVGVEDVVLLGISLGGDEDRVTLGSGDGEASDLLALNIDTVNLDNLDLVAVNVEVEHGKGRHVDDAETVGLAGNKVELGVLHLVNQARLGNGLGTAGVEDGEVLLNHDLVLLVVPVWKRREGKSVTDTLVKL